MIIWLNAKLKLSAREVVSQYAWNDHRILPPAGLPLGNVQQNGYGYLEVYTKPLVTTVNGQLQTNFVNFLPDLGFPLDNGAGNYAFYDRWTDMINTTAEFVIMDQARSLASLAFWMAQGPKKNQRWEPVEGAIGGLDSIIEAEADATLTTTAPGIDLSEAQVVWEIRYQDPMIGNPVTFKPKFSGDHWVEAEALLPDGRRIVAKGSFAAATADATPPNNYQSAPLAATLEMAALYHADGSGIDSTGKQPPLALSGNTRIESYNLGWMAERAGGALRFLDLGDQAKVQLPVASLIKKPDTSAIVVEAMIYVNEFKAFDRGVATILSLEENDWSAYLKFLEDKYEGLMLKGGTGLSFAKTELTDALAIKKWHHLRLAITKAGYTVHLNGSAITSVASGDLDYWGRAQTATLTLGNFDGWIDEIVIRNVKISGSGASLTPLGITSSGFRVRLNGEAGALYRIESSSNNKTWSEVTLIELDSTSADFTAPLGSLPKYRFYRAIKL